jgi:hypothetical protein
MNNFIIYSPVLKKAFKNLPFTNNLEKVRESKAERIYIVYCETEDIVSILKNILVSEKSTVVLFRPEDVLNGLYKYHKIGIKDFLPLAYISYIEKINTFYEFKEIQNIRLTLPRGSRLKLQENLLEVEASGELDFSLKIENNKLNSKEVKLMYEEIILHKLNSLRSCTSNIKTLMGYFKDIKYRNKITTEIVEKELGKDYAEFFDYFYKIKKRYLNIYESFQKLQFKFKKLYSIFPEPIAIIDQFLDIKDYNSAFEKFFGKIKNIKEISKYELNSNNTEYIKVFESVRRLPETGIIKIFKDRYYVFKFILKKIENNDYMIKFADITESDIFETTSIIKLTFEDTEKSKNNFEEFAQHTIWILKEIFRIKAYIKIKNKNIEYGYQNLSNPFKIETPDLLIKFEYPKEFREETKKEISKSFLRVCKTKLYSDKINNYQKDLERDLNIAKYIQDSIVKREESFSKPQYYLYYEPSNTIGGDFATTDKFENNFMFSIGDVSGHGIASALMSIFVNTVVKETIDKKWINNIKKSIYYIKKHLILVNIPEYMFVAIMYGNLDLSTNKLKYASGGFQFPMLIKRKNKIIELQTGGGIFSSAFNFEQEYHTFSIEDEDLILLFTDGIIELQNETDEVLSHVKDVLSGIKTNNPDIVITILLESLKKRFGIKKFYDDITILGFRKEYKDYDIEVYENSIYSILSTKNEKSLRKYFSELITKATEIYKIREVTKKYIINASNLIINERLKWLSKTSCSLKINITKERNILTISLINCSSKEKNSEQIDKIQSSLGNLNTIKFGSFKNNIKAQILL